MQEIELMQLPAPNFEQEDSGVKVTIYLTKQLKDLTKEEQLRACYYHACLKYVLGQGAITNSTLCLRLGIEPKNKSIASRILGEAREKDIIKPFDPDNKSPKYASYVPYWV
jgi:predicted HTH transcriptional regulator